MTGVQTCALPIYERAIFSAIRQAVQAVEAGFTEDIRQNVDKMIVPKELEHAE